MNILEKGDRMVEGVLLIGCTPCFIIMILVIALIRSCMGIGVADIDNDYMAQREQYHRLFIQDSTDNGFELVYYTTKQVSKARYKEICSRQYLLESYSKLNREAAGYFKHNLINTDIYDFVKYAKTFDIDSADVRLVNVFIIGTDYEKLYQRPNKNYPDGWKKGDDHEFGALYLKENDVYPTDYNTPHIYRYWGCSATSSLDERYTHISKDDRTQYGKP